MTKRSSIAVFFLSIITFGIYIIVWRVMTKNEMNRFGANIPSAWFMIIPFVNIWWLWQYSEAVEDITKEKLSKVVAFLALILIPSIGDAICQDYFNNIDAQIAVKTA